MKPFGHELLEAYAVALAGRLERAAAEIRQNGLNAQDFDENLTLKFQDGSTATFRYAFFLHDREARKIVIFTEHNGYLQFPSYLQIETAAGRIIYGAL